jgi:hypothetical protein
VKIQNKIIVVWLIFFLLLTVNIPNIYQGEPQLTDNLDGTWTAVWTLDDPNNYTLTDIELNSGEATLKLNQIQITENLTSGFPDGTWDSLRSYPGSGLGLNLLLNTKTQIADNGNNRVLELEYDTWSWQYGTNGTAGYNPNELNKPWFGIPLVNDNILITDSKNHRVIEVTRNGNIDWQFGLNGTWGKGDNLTKNPSTAMPMASGNILIADSGNNQVIEVNRSKNIVWQFDTGLANPMFAEELLNGSILITDQNNHRVIEVNKNKQVYWQHGTGKAGFKDNQLKVPSFATRLLNSNTLIADTGNNRVIEVDNAETIIWRYGKHNSVGYGPDRLNGPSCALRFPNGNVLIADTNNHRVFEVNSSKGWQWQYGTNATAGSGVNELNLPTSCWSTLEEDMTGNYYSSVFDGGDVTNWNELSWWQTIPVNTNINIYTRTGDTPVPGTGSWSSWVGGYTDPNGEQIGSPSNRYIQYWVEFSTSNSFFTPILHNVTITGSYYQSTGELVSEFLAPPGLLSWSTFNWVSQNNGQTIRAYYSTASPVSWTLVPGNGNLAIVPIDTGQICFKFNLTTTDLSQTPILRQFTLKYERLGALDTIEISPNPAEVIVGEELNFTATGYDPYSRELSIIPTWSSTVGVIINGTLTAQTTPGTGFVNATQASVLGSAPVTVLPGPLDHISVTPENVIVLAEDSKAFNAKGFDRFNNEIPITPTWDTDVGQMVGNLFQAQSFAGFGRVTATVGNISGYSNVTIKLNESLHHPPKIISRVPDQVKLEDSEPWTLDLTKYESDQEDTGVDLLWYLTDIDGELYSVTGAYSNDDVFVFIPVANAFGNNMATLWLVDTDNMTTYQSLWINITPVNDKPLIAALPEIAVHFEEPYTFDFSNYISDIDTPKNNLILSVLEPAGQEYTSIFGMNVTFNYPSSMLGKTEQLSLIVSDGAATAQEFLQVTISDNHAPILVKPFLDLIMFEGERKDLIFNLEDYFQDPDGDDLFYSSIAQHLTVEIQPNGSVSILASNSWSGIEIVTFRAMDSRNAVVEGHLKVTVLGINDPPQIFPMPDIYVRYEDDYQFDTYIYILDPDNNTEELKLWTSELDYITFNNVRNTLMILNYPASFLGQSITVTLYVSDGIDIATRDFIVHITDNFPPMLIKDLTDVSMNEDEEIENAFNLTDHFKDNEDTTLSFTFELHDDENITVLINSNQTVDISPKPDWFGSSYAIFRATDQHKSFVENTIQIVVIPVNDPPLIQPIPDQRGTAGERWILDLAPYLSDVDTSTDDLEIIITPENSDLVTITGKHLTIHSNKQLDKDFEFIVTDGIMNTTGSFKLIITKTSTEESSINEWILLTILIIVLLLVLIFMVLKRHGNFKITDIFVMHRNGILIKYMGNTLNEELDEDLFTGMLTGIKSLISDSFGDTLSSEEGGPILDKLKMGEFEVMFSEGELVSIIAIYKGTAGQRLGKVIVQIMTSIEEKYGDVLKDWSGRIDQLDGIDKILEPYLPEKEILSREKLDLIEQQFKDGEPISAPLPIPTPTIQPSKKPAPTPKKPSPTSVTEPLKKPSLASTPQPPKKPTIAPKPPKKPAPVPTPKPSKKPTPTPTLAPQPSKKPTPKPTLATQPPEKLTPTPTPKLSKKPSLVPAPKQATPPSKKPEPTKPAFGKRPVKGPPKKPALTTPAPKKPPIPTPTPPKKSLPTTPAPKKPTLAPPSQPPKKPEPTKPVPGKRSVKGQPLPVRRPPGYIVVKPRKLKVRKPKNPEEGKKEEEKR